MPVTFEGQQHTAMLAPPPAPHGPRSPGGQRTPSPGTPNPWEDPNAVPANSLKRLSIHNTPRDIIDTESVVQTPIYPSEKALGKKKAIDAESITVAHADPESEDNYVYDFDHKNGMRDADSESFISDSSDSRDGREHHWNSEYRWKHPPVHYVYDAAAERTKQRILEGQVKPNIVV
jgi:hypothetical protein